MDTLQTTSENPTVLWDAFETGNQLVDEGVPVRLNVPEIVEDDETVDGHFLINKCRNSDLL